MSRSYAYLRCFHPLCLARVTYWWAHLMHICGAWSAAYMHFYGASAHFAQFEWPIDEQILCIFTVLPLTLPSWSDLLESRSYAYLRCFRSLCLARVTHWWAAFMHIYGHFAYLEWPVDSRSYAYLRCFRSLCLVRVTSWSAAYMHFYGASAHFA